MVPPLMGLAIWVEDGQFNGICLYHLVQLEVSSFCTHDLVEHLEPSSKLGIVTFPMVRCNSKLCVMVLMGPLGQFLVFILQNSMKDMVEWKSYPSLL